jgi:hypothetical protein
LLAVLVTLAASDVVNSPMYIGFYLLMGIGFVGVLSSFFPLVGLSLRRDALERGNRATAIALAGAMLGLACCFAGGNIGDGPGWWVVVFCALLATIAWYALWALFELMTGTAEHVSVDRDLASGVRLAALLTAMGVILGRAVAGDWESAEATVADFVRMCWPAIALAVLAIAVQYLCRPSPNMPRPSLSVCGVFPAFVYLAIAGAWLAIMGTGR